MPFDEYIQSDGEEGEGELLEAAGAARQGGKRPAVARPAQEDQELPDQGEEEGEEEDGQREEGLVVFTPEEEEAGLVTPFREHDDEPPYVWQVGAGRGGECRDGRSARGGERARRWWLRALALVGCEVKNRNNRSVHRIWTASQVKDTAHGPS